MFDVSFTELLLIGGVSLIVLGPEKLPGAVRTAALMIGRLKRSFNTLKTEIEKEIGADEIRRQLRNEDIMEKFKQTQSVLNNTINSVKEGTEEFRKNIELESESAGWSSHGEPAQSSTDNSLPGAASVEPPAIPATAGLETTPSEAAAPANAPSDPSANQHANADSTKGAV